MHKNILIIGYGDIGRRLKTNIDNVNIYAVGRSSEEEDGVHKISWDWLSDKRLAIQNIFFDSIKTNVTIIIQIKRKKNHFDIHSLLMTSQTNLLIAINFIKIY